MGYGAYDSEAHTALTTSRASLPREEVFTQTNLHPDMDPKGVKYRESRDSAAHPDSVGIIFALDETGSMGHIPEMLAREPDQLPSFMRLIIDGDFVRDPQVMFVGVGDAVQSRREEAPLQVGQFESEAHLMDQWLTRMYLEGMGGGNDGESYDLAFYFAARHTAMDCWEKRGKKGYLFVTGDEPPLKVSKGAVKDRIGDKLDGDIPMKTIAVEASKTFHCFFIIPDKERAERCERRWRDVLGDNVIVLEDPKDTCAAAATLIGLTEGTLEDLDAAAQKLKALGRKRDQINRVIRAVEPYAASIGRGGPTRPAEDADLPKGKGKSGNRRI